MDRFRKLGVALPEILLPAPGVDAARWGVVACDQFTAQPAYWEAAERLVGEAPSTLRMILPEAFLGTDREASLSRRGPETMARYLTDGTLTSYDPGMILVERTLASGVRRGLMLALDLEAYDYSPHSASLIRATEKTIVERIPPRMRIRREALLELPHIMVLIDDPEDRVLGAARRGAGACLYDTELMAGGGHLTGYAVKEEALEAVASGLESLIAGQEKPILFAMGDGNHSLATAKACWEERKTALSPEERENDPARFALAEVVNLHDPALAFAPIHRVIFHTDPAVCLARLRAKLEAAGCPTTLSPEGGGCPIGVVTEKGEEILWLGIGGKALPVAVLQPALDAALAAGETLDFIHGDDALREVAGRPGCLGLKLPPFEKAALFPTVQTTGPLPRKSFSMGEAHEKRYYFECRRIRNR